MATKQEFLDSIKRLEANVADRQAANAVAQAKITELISEGKTREAYRVFEELPIMDQIALSVTPGFGDALAAFEVGEFKTRAGERFAQDDILGGLGNVALSGLAGASLLPVIGPIAGAAGKVGKSLGRVAKTDIDMPAGGGFPVNRPNEYVGTRPVNIDSDYGLKPETGLISPNRAALQKLDSKPLKLDTLVSKLRKAAPNKEGELRMLGLLDDKNQVSSLARKYFAGQEKVSPAALDQYLSLRQREALNVVRPKKIDYASPGYDDIDAETEVQRIYQVKGVNNSLAIGNKHYNQLGIDDAIAFDSTDLIDDGILRVGRIQSDYDPLLKKLRAEAETDRINFEGGSLKDIPSRQDINPFELPDKPTTLKTLKEQPGYDKIKKLIEELNNSVDSYNLFATKNLKGIYGPDGLPIAAPKSIKKLSKSDVKAQKTETSKQSDILNEIQDTIENLGGPIYSGEDIFVRELITDRLPKTAKKIAEREINYGNLNPDDYARTGKLSTDLDPDYYGLVRTKDNLNLEFDVKPHVNIEETLKKLEKDFAELQGEKLESNIKFNVNKPKLDPYAGVGAKSTKSYVLPVRNLMNESLQDPSIKTLVFEGDSPLIREGGATSKVLQNYYKNAQKEAVKVVNEIAEDTDFMVIKKIDDAIHIDIDSIREYLKNTGQEPKISAFKDGGLANIDSLLNKI